MPEPRNPEPRVPAKLVARDRRSAVRFHSNCKALVSPLHSDQAPILSQIRDVSATGIGLVSARPYEQGTALFISVREDGSDSSPILVAKVVHALPAEDGSWLVGCKLMRRLSEADLQGLAADED